MCPRDARQAAKLYAEILTRIARGNRDGFGLDATESLDLLATAGLGISPLRQAPQDGQPFVGNEMVASGSM